MHHFEIPKIKKLLRLNYFSILQSMKLQIRPFSVETADKVSPERL